jgi:ABC-type uncharacterized transport system auxiliary subunit
MAVGAVACASTPTRRYYTLSYPLERDPATESRPPLHPVQLRVRPFRSGLPYDRPQIVYRQSPYEFQYYVYQLWAAKPQRMLRELVQSHLESTRLVAEVTRDYGERLPDYELVAEVLAVEEYDSGPVWYGHLAMRFELVRFSDKMPLWNYHFDRKRKVFEKQPVYVVRTLSEILADEMARVTAELDRVISADRGVAPTLALPPPPVDDEAPRKAARIRTSPRRRDVPDALSDPVTQPDSQELIVPEDEEALPLILPDPEPGR